MGCVLSGSLFIQTFIHSFTPVIVILVRVVLDLEFILEGKWEYSKGYHTHPP